MLKKGSFLRELPVIIIAALVVSIIVKTFLVHFFYIPSGSMENTLQVGDRIAVNKFGALFTDIKRGEVVVFGDPDNWLGDSAQSGDSGIGAGGIAVLDGPVYPSLVGHARSVSSHLPPRLFGDQRVGGLCLNGLWPNRVLGADDQQSDRYNPQGDDPDDRFLSFTLCRGDGGGDWFGRD